MAIRDNQRTSWISPFLGACHRKCVAEGDGERVCGVVRLRRLIHVEDAFHHELHLLFVSGLVQKYGLVWDPVPLPLPGEGNLYRKIEENQKSFLVISVVYLLLFGVLLVLGMKKAT